MQGVGRWVGSGGQKHIRVSIVHERAGVTAAEIKAISREISRLARAAEQWTLHERRLLLLVRIFRQYFGEKRPAGFLSGAELLLNG